MALVLACAAPLYGAIKVTDVSSLQVTPDELFLSDALIGGSAYNRDALDARLGIKVEDDGETAQLIIRVCFQLVDGEGSPITLLNESDEEVEFIYTEAKAFINEGTGDMQAFEIECGVRLRPAGGFEDGMDYGVVAVVQEFSEDLGDFVDTSFGGDFGPQTYRVWMSTDPTDDAVNVRSRLNSVNVLIRHIVDTDPTEQFFGAQIGFALERYDAFLSPLQTNDVTVRATVHLRDAVTDAAVPLQQSVFLFDVSMDSFQPGVPNVPAQRSFTRGFSFRPSGQMDSTREHYLEVVLEHLEDPVAVSYLPGGTIATAAQDYLQFNGTVRWGIINTTITNLTSVPVPGNTLAGFIEANLSYFGALVSQPSYTYTGNFDLQLLPNGDALAAPTESTTVAPPSLPDTSTVGGVFFERLGPLVLQPSGLTTDIRVVLPMGMGYSTVANSKLLNDELTFPDVVLNNDVLPLGAQTLTFPTPYWFTEESKPVSIGTQILTWLVSQGEFVIDQQLVQQVRDAQYASTLAAPLLPKPIKKTNSGYYRTIGPGDNEATFAARGNNNSSVLSARLQFTGGQFTTHFPRNVLLGWTDVSTLVISEDEIDVTQSAMNGVSDLRVRYLRSCVGIDCPGAADYGFAQLSPENQILFFTPDGGLTAAGPLVSGGSSELELRWGLITPATTDYAHETDSFANARFLMSGLSVKGGQTNLNVNNRPGVILLSGFSVSKDGGVVTERPGTTGYEDAGLTDYAGMNYRVEADGSQTGLSLLAGSTLFGPWDLTSRAKYYVRDSGVTGIHEKVPEFEPIPLVLWGYDFSFVQFGFSFLSNNNKDNRSEGSITVPYPSDIIIEFDEVSLTCKGAPRDLVLPEPINAEVLSYWLADIQPHNARFVSDICDPNAPGAVLVMGVTAYSAHVAQPLYGTIGFEPDLPGRNAGNLVTLEYSLTYGVVEPINSRFEMPGLVTVPGPQGNDYTFIPTTKAYLNNATDLPPVEPSQPGVGFMNWAGLKDVAFFEDLRVHVHTLPLETWDTTTLLFATGSWDNGGVNHFESGPFFDPDNRGYAPGVSLEVYRDVGGAGDDQYRVFARQDVFDTIELNSPLSWSTATRSYQSVREVKEDFFLVSADYNVDYLDSRLAHVSFGAKVAGLENLSIANLAVNVLDEQTGVLSSLVDTISQGATDLLVGGLDDMTTLLDPKMDDFWQKNLSGKLNSTTLPPNEQTLNELYAALQGAYNPNTDSFNNLPAVMTNYFTSADPASVQSKLQGIMGQKADEVGVVQDIDDALASLQEAIDVLTVGSPMSANGIFEPNSSDEFQIVENLLNELINRFAGNIGVNLGSLAGPADDKLNELLEKRKPTILEVRSTLIEIRDIVADVRAALDDGPDGNFRAELQQIVDSPGGSMDITDISAAVRDDLQNNFFLQMSSNTIRFDEYTQEEIDTRVQQAIRDALYQSQVYKRVNVTMRSRLYSVDASIREAVSSGLQQVNSLARDFLSDALSDLIDGALSGALGDFGSSFGTAEINGYAEIAGDSLKKLFLEMKMEMKMPSEIGFEGFLQICELDSDGDNGCSYAGQKATEITVGANNVGVSWPGAANMRFDIWGKVTLVNNIPAGMGGGFRMTEGKIDFQALAITRLGVDLMFGLEENYFAAEAGMTLKDAYALSGGFFGGRSCTIKPIQMVDKDIADTVGPNGPFTGTAIYGEAHIPLNEALGIPSTCLFKVTAGAGVGFFLFIEGPTIGAKMLFAVSGQALCLISIKGEVSLVGALVGSDIRGKGRGTFCAELGPCPFCIEICKTVELFYRNESFSVKL